jgi:hypothetical protein
MRCQLEVVAQAHFVYTRQTLQPNTKAIMTSADRRGGAVGGIYSARLEVKRAITNENANYLLEGPIVVWGMSNRGGTEITFAWADLKFREVGSFYFEMAVMEHVPDMYRTPYMIRARATSSEIIVAEPAGALPPAGESWELFDVEEE